MKLIANSVTKTTYCISFIRITGIWLSFLLLSSTVREMREKVFPGVKSEKFVPAKNGKIQNQRKFKISRETFMPLGIGD